MTCRMRTVVMIALATALWARSGGMLSRGRGEEFRTRLDSLQRLPPNLRYYEMSRDPMFTDALKAASSYPDSGITMLSKWGRGPSVKVTGRDTLIFLSLGSEVAIINMRNPTTPRVVSEVQARSVVARSVLKDSFLIIGGQGIEIWNVADPAHPVHRVDIPVTVSDICILDSLLLSISGDSFRVFNVALASNPRPMGASHDTGTSVTASGHTAYIGIYNRTAPLGVIDLQNPANPHLVGLWGQYVLTPSAIDSFCYVTIYDPQNPGWFRFTVLDVANPLSIVERGHLDNAGGYDIYPLEWFAYVAGPSPSTSAGVFRIVDVSDPNWPTIVSSCATPTASSGVWVNDPFGHAQVADWSEGLDVIDINDPVHPLLDTSLLQADAAQDIAVQSGLAAVADGSAGLRLLDVREPTSPVELGAYDSSGMYTYLEAVALRDSFAFSGGFGASMRSVDISDPTHPVFAALAPGNGWEDRRITIRGNLAYLACDSRFQIYDIANPRAMRLLGSVPNGGIDVELAGNYAYLLGAGMLVYDISHPATPVLVDSLGDFYGGRACIKDTFLYVVWAYDSLLVWDIADAHSPREVGSTSTWRLPMDVAIEGDLMFVGTAAGLQVFRVSDPAHPVEVAGYPFPLGYGPQRVIYDSGLVYAACYDAGIAIFEMLPSGLAEPSRVGELHAGGLKVRVFPQPVRGRCNLEITSGRGSAVSIKVLNAAGRVLREYRLPPRNEHAKEELDFAPPGHGLLLISVSDGRERRSLKLVIE